MSPSSPPIRPSARPVRRSRAPRSRSASALLAAGVVGLALPAVPLAAPALGPAAVASSTYHCTDYSGCNRAGYTDYGYGAVNRTMYWRMYGGHNCTNYVAYRMIKAGMSSARPWSGSGMARNWGLAMSKITDKTPAVGAVAWWAAGDGVGSSGHVAVVEKVISSTQIQISEDSWSGTFHWRTITKDGSGWPTGFIHFADKPSEVKKNLVNSAAPTISGTPQVGTELTAAPGTWKPGGDYTYQWLADGTAVAGATSATYTPGPDLAGRSLRVQVAATRSGYTPGSAVSAPTAAVQNGRLRAAGLPTVSGEAKVGAVLTATTAGWSPKPARLAFRWRADGAIIPGQSGRTLTVTRELLGRTITVSEVARSKGFAKETVDSTDAVGPIVEGVITTPQPFRASGQAKLGASMMITPGTVAPRDASVAYEWLRDGQVVPGETSPTYRLTAADVGKRIVAHVVLTKQNFAPVRRTYVMGGAVTTTSDLAVRAIGKKRAAVLGVRLTAPGLGGVDGPVVVRIGGKQVTGEVRNGHVRVMVPNLKPGTRKVVVVYEGTEVVAGSRASTTVDIAR